MFRALIATLLLTLDGEGRYRPMRTGDALRVGLLVGLAVGGLSAFLLANPVGEFAL